MNTLTVAVAQDLLFLILLAAAVIRTSLPKASYRREDSPIRL
jgi:hypothetical protein